MRTSDDRAELWSREGEGTSNPGSDGKQGSQVSLFVGLMQSNTCRYFKLWQLFI